MWFVKIWSEAHVCGSALLKNQSVKVCEEQAVDLVSWLLYNILERDISNSSILKIKRLQRLFMKPAVFHFYKLVEKVYLDMYS